MLDPARENVRVLKRRFLEKMLDTSIAASEKSLGKEYVMAVFEKKRLERISYTGLMETARHQKRGHTSEEVLELLDFMVSTVIDDACSRPAVSLLSGSPLPRPSDLFPASYYDEDGIERLTATGNTVDFSLPTVRVYAVPWKVSGLMEAVLQFKERVFQYNTNHTCYYVPEWNLCYVANGNHSVLGAKYNGQGTVRAELCPLHPLFPHIKTDGVNWINKHTGNVLFEVYDFRIAAAYGLSQMSWATSRGKQE